MTHEQANELLDALKNGADAPQAWINAALELTGDIQPPVVEFLKKNGRSNSLAIASGLSVAPSTARKYLQTAVQNGLALRKKVGAHVFYTANPNPSPKPNPKRMRPVLGEASASAHLNNVWGWVKP